MSIPKPPASEKIFESYNRRARRRAEPEQQGKRRADRLYEVLVSRSRRSQGLQQESAPEGTR